MYGVLEYAEETNSSTKIDERFVSPTSEGLTIEKPTLRETGRRGASWEAIHSQ